MCAALREGRDRGCGQGPAHQAWGPSGEGHRIAVSCIDADVSEATESGPADRYVVVFLYTVDDGGEKQPENARHDNHNYERRDQRGNDEALRRHRARKPRHCCEKRCEQEPGPAVIRAVHREQQRHKPGAPSEEHFSAPAPARSKASERQEQAWTLADIPGQPGKEPGRPGMYHPGLFGELLYPAAAGRRAGGPAAMVY